MPANAPLAMSRSDGIATLTLNRPERRNVLSDEMLAALRDALAALEKDQDTRAIILRADGPAFCAGHDLGEMTARRSDPDGGRDAFADLFARCTEVMAAIVRHSRPVLAEVQGAAVAAGCQLEASCDLAVASERAYFATPGVKIGLFCSTPMVALGRNVGRKQAMEMLLLGERVDARRAAELGLVNRVVAADSLRDESRALAQAIAANSPAAIRHGKRAFHEQLDLNLDEAYAHAGQVMAVNMLAADADEGISAFLEKREPVWPSPR